jgi:hypothetical protein
MRVVIVLIMGYFVSFGTISAIAETSKTSISYYSSEYYPVLERTVNILTANPTRRNSFLFIIDHRNRMPINEEPFDNFFGFDGGGLKIGLGLRYGLTDDADIGIYRLNGTAETFDTYEFDFRYRLLRQEKHFVDLAIRPGYTLFVQPHGQDASAGFIQVLINRTFHDRLRLGTGFLYHSDSSNDVKSDRDSNSSSAFFSSLEFRILPQLAWSIEMSETVAGYHSAHPRISSSLKYLTDRHIFSLVFSNSQYTGADGIVSNTDRSFSDIILGFSITRELSF